MLIFATALLALGQTTTIPFDIPSGNDLGTTGVEFTIPGFPSGLGTLDKVTISLTTQADIDCAVENMTPYNCCAFAGRDLCNDPALPTPPNWARIELYDRDENFIGDHTTFCADKSVNLAPFDGNDNFAGRSGAVMHQGDSTTDRKAAVITGDVPLDMWRRVDLTLVYKRLAYTGSGSSCGGAVHHGDSGKARGRIEVTYSWH